ncbi:hypothetical protein Tco_1061238, partial [Tanacetum coccineum]
MSTQCKTYVVIRAVVTIGDIHPLQACSIGHPQAHENSRRVRTARSTPQVHIKPNTLAENVGLNALAEWRSSEQVENGIASTSPPYWEDDDDDYP